MEDTTRNSLKAGFSEAIPLAIAVGAYGLSYGVLAQQAHFSFTSTLAMSLLVFSGSVQMVSVAMVMGGAAITSVLFTALLLNLRNLLYGTALAQGLSPARKKWRWLLAFGVSDEPFVLGSARFQKHGPDPIYFGVVTGTIYIAWILASAAGALIGDQVDPLKWGLDLAFPVTFVALLVPSLKDKPIIATACTAVLIAFALESIAPGNEFTIIVTGLLSPITGLLLKRGTQHA